MYLSMSYVPCNRSTARLLTASAYTPMRRSPTRRCSRVTPSELIGRLLAPLSFKIFWRFTRDVKLECRNDPLEKFGLAPVPNRHLSRAISCVSIPRWTYVLSLVLANSGISFCFGLRGHIFLEGICDSKVHLPKLSMVSLLCLSARCFVVADDADLYVSDNSLDL